MKKMKLGTIIDHIPTKINLKLFNLCNLIKKNYKVTIKFNLPSKKIYIKNIIKIENKFLNRKKINQLSIYLPSITINYIKNYKIIKKKSLKIPKKIKKILICPNKNCISHDKNIVSYFILKKYIKKKKIKCFYCEIEFSKKIIFKNLFY